MTRAKVCSWIVGLLLGLPAAVMAQEAFTTTAVNLRAGPDSDYPVVRWVPEGTAVEVHGCLSDYRWCDVEVYGDRGWMFATYLIYPYQSAHVPIPSYGPVIGLPILGFTIDSYWDDHYRRRPWYSDRPRWAHRHRPEYHPPRYRPPQHRPPQFHPPGNRPPEFRQPQYRPPQVQPPRAQWPNDRPSYRPPDVRQTPRPDYRPPDVHSRPSQPGFRPPEVMRPPSPRPPSQQPSMRPPAPQQPGAGRSAPGRDPQSVRDNPSGLGGINTGTY